MTKLLNLDDLATEETKIIKFKGVEHLAATLTVQGYIDRVARAKAVDASANEDDAETNLKKAIELVGEVFPTLTADLLGSIPLTNLRVIINFALAAPSEIADAVESAAVSAPATVVSSVTPDGATLVTAPTSSPENPILTPGLIPA